MPSSSVTLAIALRSLHFLHSRFDAAALASGIGELVADSGAIGGGSAALLVTTRTGAGVIVGIVWRRISHLSAATAKRSLVDDDAPS